MLSFFFYRLLEKVDGMLETLEKAAQDENDANDR